MDASEQIGRRDPMTRPTDGGASEPRLLAIHQRGDEGNRRDQRKRHGHGRVSQHTPNRCALDRPTGWSRRPTGAQRGDAESMLRSRTGLVMAATSRSTPRYGWVVGWLYFHGVAGGPVSLLRLLSEPIYIVPYLCLAAASIAAAWGLQRDERWAWPLAIAIESISVIGCVAAAVFGGEGAALVQGVISLAAVVSLARSRTTADTARRRERR